MSGKEFKNALSNTGISFADIAVRMQVTVQSLNSTFNSKDIKSGIIEKAASALQLPITFFYGIDQPDKITNVVHHVGSNSNVANGNSHIEASDPSLVQRLLDELTELRKQNAELQKALLSKL